MTLETFELKTKAEEYRFLYKTGQVSREEAKEVIMLYLDAINNKSKELAKKYNQKYKPVTLASFLR